MKEKPKDRGFFKGTCAGGTCPHHLTMHSAGCLFRDDYDKETRQSRDRKDDPERLDQTSDAAAYASSGPGGCSGR